MWDKKKDEKDDYKSSEKEKFQISHDQAVKVAKLYLKRFQLTKAWKDAVVSNRFPLYTPSEKVEVAYYEIKISRPKINDVGYIVVNANGKDIPIPCFATTGKTYTERLEAKCMGQLVKVIWHTPSYVTAEDLKGQTIASIGVPPIFEEPSKDDEIVGSIKPLHQEKKIIKRKKKTLERDQATFIDHQWQKIKIHLGIASSQLYKSSSESHNDENNGGAGGTGGVDIEDSLYTIRYANGSWNQPTFSQISPSDDINDTNHWSGCGPTAWAALVAYHDLHWDPCLLYGTHTSLSSYIKRLLMIFHDVLGTHQMSRKDDNGIWLGDTHREDMEKGYEVLEQYLLHGQGSDLGWWAYNGSYQQEFYYAYDMIYEKRHPLIVNYRTEKGGHYALGYGIAIGETIMGSITDAYILANNLHGGDGSFIDDQRETWVHFFYIRGVWSLNSMAYSCPRRKSTETSINPVVTSPMDMTRLNDGLYMIFPIDKNIHIYKTDGINYPIPTRNNPENPKSVSFDKSIILPSNRYHTSASDVLNSLSNFPELVADNATPHGPISSCAWNYEKIGTMIISRFTGNNENQNNDSDSLRAEERENNTPSIPPNEETIIASGKVSNLETLGHVMYARYEDSFQEKSGPYLFLCWRGPRDHNSGKSDPNMPYNWDPIGSPIHIAVLEIPSDLDFTSIVNENGILKSDALNFAHIILPRRFKTVVAPAITIAEDQNTGPMLYIAYSGDDFSGGSLVSHTGFLLIIKLQTLFQMMINGDDRWPSQRSEPTGGPGIIERIVTETRYNPLDGTNYTVDIKYLDSFNWYWVPFDCPVHHVNLDSNGKKVSLIWTSDTNRSPYPTLGSAPYPSNILFAKKDYCFTANQVNGGWPDWGDCTVKVRDSNVMSEYFHQYAHIQENGEILVNGRPVILSTREGRIIAWNGDGLIYFGTLWNSNIVGLQGDLLYSSGFPSIHFVTDSLGNKNFVLGYHSQHGIIHRIFYIDPLITDYDNLPR